MDKSQFKTVFYDLILETEIGKIEGHFSPINSLAFSPDGTSFVTGGEDGYVRLCHFDKKYLESNRSERSGLIRHQK